MATKKHPKWKLSADPRKKKPKTVWTPERWTTPTKTVVKSQSCGFDSLRKRKKIRAEIAKREAKLIAERKKINKRLGGTRFSVRRYRAISKHMRPFAFTAEQVRKEVK